MKRVCLVDGNHTPGSDWEGECPLRNAERRSERSRKAAQTRQERLQRPVARTTYPGQPAAG